MAIALPIETSRGGNAATDSESAATCQCDHGVLYEHQCCGRLAEGRCCMDPEWVVRECDLCGGDGAQ
jgi:hypothetical protein